MGNFFTGAGLLAIVASSVLTGAAEAGEVRYRYDALGRLVQAEHTGANAHDVHFAYDRAGNRTSQVVGGSENGSATAVIVVPLGSSFAVIPIDRHQ